MWRVRGSISKTTRVTSGEILGSGIGALAFTFFINYLLQVIKHATILILILMFADEVKLIQTIKWAIVSEEF